MNADDGHYGAHLAAEVLALRDSIQGWQSAGRPEGRPIDIDADASGRVVDGRQSVEGCCGRGQVCDGVGELTGHLRLG